MSVPTAFDLPSSITPSSSSSSSTPLTFRERRGFTLWLSFSPAFPNIQPKGELGPTYANIPRRRKRSSVVSLDMPVVPAPVPAPAPEPSSVDVGRASYFS
ncbi:hypothetical protein C8F01DRAFT_1247499 [Mycena amicta]|nr:hypothetical protein C8F01DRAFT_1247499 [Mycena amicta]